MSNPTTHHQKHSHPWLWFPMVWLNIHKHTFIFATTKALPYFDIIQSFESLVEFDNITLSSTFTFWWVPTLALKSLTSCFSPIFLYVRMSSQKSEKGSSWSTNYISWTIYEKCNNIPKIKFAFTYCYFNPNISFLFIILVCRIPCHEKHVIDWIMWNG